MLRLAGELEQQPWVVQIKAIPTASVPVIKILADPAQLGSLGNISGVGHDIGLMNQGEYYPSQDPKGEWMIPETASQHSNGNQPVPTES